jgi:hypothetical protein
MQFDLVACGDRSLKDADIRLSAERAFETERFFAPNRFADFG